MANILESARTESSLSKFVKGIESVNGLADVLSGYGPFTFFAPTDTAYEKLSDNRKTKLLGNPEKLAKMH